MHNGLLLQIDKFRYDAIISYVENLAKDYPEIVQLSYIGDSVEGRKIPLLKIGNTPFGEKTRAVWFDAGNAHLD